MHKIKRDFLNYQITDFSLKKAWDEIAHDYYNDEHKTCRIFDAVIDYYLPRFFKKLKKKGIILDLGGGKGRISNLLNLSNYKYITLDISHKMLQKGGITSQNKERIQSSVLHLPLREQMIDGIFSLLGDSYILPKLFELVYRSLKKNGIFIFALPTKIWALTLRSILDIPEDRTVFHNSDSEPIIVPSYVYSEDQIKNYLRIFKFKEIKINQYTIKNIINIRDLSQHILLPSNYLKISPEDLPIITITYCSK